MRLKIFISLLTIGLVLQSCSTTEKRTRFSDKNMRIMIDPASISPENYARIQTALVQQQMWVVLDRAAGLEAIKKEQQELHRTSIDRYEDKEKYAHWGRLYGVGAVVVAHAQCFQKKGFWTSTVNTYCDQFINLIDANTGEVIVAVEGGEYAEDSSVAPDWKEIVSKLANIYPTHFDRVPASERMEIYKKESEERARQQKEKFIQSNKNEEPEGQNNGD